jgi:hypothetical protein
MEIQIKRGKTPTKEGYYFWITSLDIQLVEVVYVEPCEHCGLKWGGYYSVVGHGGRRVERMDNDFSYFSEEVTFNIDKN